MLSLLTQALIQTCWLTLKVTAHCNGNSSEQFQTINTFRYSLWIVPYEVFNPPYESDLKEEFLHVDPVIHLVYDTLHSQEVRRLHIAWLNCCHSDRNDTEPKARQEKSGGFLWMKFSGDRESVKRGEVGEWIYI